MDLTPDVSAGQRGFNRNIDRLCNQLIAYYRKNYPKDAENTLHDIKKKEEEEKQAELDAIREEEERQQKLI